MSVLSINNELGLEAFKRMVIQGVAPEDIADRFGMTVSNVHYHKKKLKEKFHVNFPNVRGQRPKKDLEKWLKILPDGKIVTQAITPENIAALSKLREEKALQDHMPTTTQEEGYQVTINGTRFFISPKAKEIHINGKDSIEVNF